MKYDGTNYPSYKRTMNDIMVMCRLTKYYNGSAEQPDDIESPEYEKWLSNVTTVIHIMRLNCDDERKSMVEECKSAQEILDVLQESYLSVSTCNRMRLERKFNRFTMDPKKPFQESINELNKLARELKEVGSEKKPSDKLDAILAGLAPSLKDYLPVWKVDKTLTYSDLCAQIINIEQDFEKDAPSAEVKPSVALVAPETKQKKPYRGKHRGSSKPLKCWRCEKIGHKAKDCRTPLGNECSICKRKGHSPDKCWFKDRNSSDDQPKISALAVLDKLSAVIGDSEWILDSGASYHMSGNPKNFHHLHNITSVKVIGASGKTMSANRAGSVHIGNHQVDGVIFVPSFQFNLLSVSQLANNGAKVEFHGDKASIMRDNEVVLEAQRGSDGLYRVVNTSVKHFSLVSQVTWHERLGHISYGKARKMLPYIEKNCDFAITKIDKCNVCIEAKQKRNAFGAFGGLRSTRPLELVHTDLLEVNIPSLGGKRYILTFIDDFTRYAKVRFIAKKHMVFDELMQCIAEAERETSFKVTCIRSDNGGEYHRLAQSLREKGIKWETSTSYTPEMNGVAERYNGKLLEMARTLMLESNLPKFLWAELINTANYLLNRAHHSAIDAIPYCKYHGKQSISVDHYRRIGCKAYVLINETSNKHFRGIKRKFEPRSKCMTLVGYDTSEKVYRLYESETRTVIRSRDVRFIEHEKGLGLSQINAKNESELEINHISFNDGFLYPENDTLDVEIEMSNHSENKVQSISQESVQAIKEAISEQEAGEHLLHGNNARLEQFDIEVPPVPEGEYELLRALVSQAETESNEEPSTVNEAKSSTHWPEWRKAMELEYNSLISNNTWEYSELPQGRQVVSGKWVFKVKHDQFGRIARYKARYVARGFSQVKGLDYQETFSPTVKYVSLRILIALSVQFDWNIDQIDYETAFLNGDLQEDIYIEEPEGFESNPRRILKLKKALYGLKQAPREWNQKLDSMLKGISFKQCRVDAGLYYADIEGGKKMYITVFVDDLLCFYPRQSDKAKHLKEQIKAGFKSKDLGECSHILGMHVVRDRTKGIITINQRLYIQNLLTKFQMQDCIPVTTPLNPGTIYTVSGLKDLPESALFGDVTLYQKAIGSLVYLTISTRPDIAFAVTLLARFMSKPREVHWSAVKRVFRYLKGTSDYQLVYSQEKPIGPVGYADASFAPDLADCRSIMGYVFLISGGAVIWKTQRQSSVARSTCDAEFMALGHCASEAAWLNNLFIDIEVTAQIKPIQIFGDNQSSIKVAKHPVFHQRTKHIAIQYHYTRELVSDGLIDVAFVSSKEMIADVLTKGLGPQLHNDCVKGLGLS